MSSKLAIIVADFTTTLATSLSIGSETGTLSSIIDDDGVNLPNGRYFFTLDASNSSKEHISCTISGTSVSDIKSISRQAVVTTGIARAHRLGATVTITNFAHILYINNLLNGTDNLDASNPLEYDGSATITGNNQLTTLEKVLTLVNGGTVSIDQTVIAARAGETVASGESLYQSESDGEWYKTDADNIAKSVNVNLGIAQGAGTDGNVIAGGVLIGGLDKTQTYTAGDIYYLSDTPGDLSTSPGTNSVIVGVGDANNNLVWVNIYDRDAVTPSEKQFLLASTGMISMYASSLVPTGFLPCDGASVSKTTYSELYDVIGLTYGIGTGIIATTNDTTDIFTKADHGLLNGAVLRLTSSGTLPTGLSLGTDYFVINTATNTFQVSTTLGGSAVNLTSAGSGDTSYHTDFQVPNLSNRFTLGVTGSTDVGDTGGAATHTLTVDEIPAHSHFNRWGVGTSSGGADLASGNKNPVGDTDPTANTGGGQPHNNMPPYLVINYIIKT